MKKIKIFILSLSLFFQSQFAFSNENASAKSDLSMQEIALPSEVKDLNKQSGSIYYNTSVKNKVLVPAHFWGEVGRPGLHFIPTDTSLIKGLSMAGGPNGSAKIDEVILTRTDEQGKLIQKEFNLSEGGGVDAYNIKIEAGDSIFIKKDLFREDRAYYTGLIGIAISIISTVVLLQKVK